MHTRYLLSTCTNQVSVHSTMATTRLTINCYKGALFYTDKSLQMPHQEFCSLFREIELISYLFFEEFPRHRLDISRGQIVAC